jgi:hypothetical protein
VLTDLASDPARGGAGAGDLNVSALPATKGLL